MILKAFELAGKNALVTGSDKGLCAAIAPGYMATGNTRPMREDPVRSRQVLERIPAGRSGKPEDLCGAAIFLCLSAAD